MTANAFVTGAGGFIASHLVEALLTRGCNVTALIHYNARGTWGWLEKHHHLTPPNLNVILGDITDPFWTLDVLKNCDVVFHLAALIAVPYSYHAPASYIRTNVDGTLNVAQAALKNGIKRFVHTSTSEVYGTAQYTPLNEEHPLHAQSPYAASKIAADKVIESFVCSYDLPTVIVRPFNTYGPRQSARAVIPNIIMQALSGNHVKLGALNPVRDFTFITDTVDGFIKAGEADGTIGETINLGSGEAVSVGDLAQMIFEILKVSPAIVRDIQRVRPKASEVMELISCNAKAAKLLHWKPTISLREGLIQTIQWMRENRDLLRPAEYAL